MERNAEGWGEPRSLRTRMEPNQEGSGEPGALRTRIERDGQGSVPARRAGIERDG